MSRRLLFLALTAAVLSFLVAADPLGDARTDAASPSGAPTTVWGDLRCNGDLGGDDALVILADIIGLPTRQEDFCPIVGSPVSPGGGPTVAWGDLTCDDLANLADVLLLLIAVAGGDVDTGLCPEIGAATSVQPLASPGEIGDDWYDYGDAPNFAATGYSTGAANGAFPVSPVDGGPYHPLPFAAWLGEFATTEDSPVLIDSADDGLLLLDLEPCATSTALIAINAAGLTEEQRADPLYLNVSADWNRDGTWGGSDSCAPEAALVNMEIDVSDTPDFDVLAIEFEAGAQVDEFWTRLTLTTEPINGAVGGETDGETEDYLVIDGLPSDGPLAASTSIAQPQGGPKAGNQFVCKGGVVPHGAGQTLTLDIEQTTASKNAGFTTKQFRATMPQPTDEEGTKVPGNPVGGTELKMSTLPDGRVRIRLTVTMNSTADAPERLVGPWLLQVGIEGKQQNDKKFEGYIDCAFYIDHSGSASAQNPDEDGFTGGPGRAGEPGATQPRFIFAPHDKKITIATDAPRTDEEKGGTTYDKASVQVFGPDGVLIPSANLKTAAGIKEIKVAANGRGLQIIPVKDNRAEPLQRIVIKVKGLLPDGTTEIWDYYRIIFLHEKGAKAKELVDNYTKSWLASNHQYLEENQTDFLAYTTNGDSHLVYHTPPHAGLDFDPETVCISGDSGPIHNAGFGNPGTSFTMDHVTNVNSDLLYIPEIPDEHGVAVPCIEIANNLTNFGPNSPYYLTNGGRCGTGFVFTEYNGNTDTYRQGLVNEMGAPWGLGPIAGGSNIYEATCYETMTGEYRLTGTMDQLDGTSDGVMLACPDCPGHNDANHTSLESNPVPTVIIDATVPNTHIRSLVVSPDTTKILWQVLTTEADGATFVDAQIWAGDLNTNTLEVTNRHQLTSVGANFTPAWSPDGTQIAFVTNRDANFEVYIMDANGANQTNITNTPAVTERGLSWQAP